MTDTEICNMALSKLNVARITDLRDGTDTSRQATECRLIYDITRDMVLRDFPWNFARKRQVLALVTDEYVGYDYAYMYPSDAVRAVEIYNPTSSMGYEDGYVVDGLYIEGRAKTKTPKIPYEVVTNSTLTHRHILTDQADATLIYTARVINPNNYDSSFIQALVWRLAADLANPMKAQPQLADQLMQRYMLALGSAEASDADEASEIPAKVSSYESARG